MPAGQGFPPYPPGAPWPQGWDPSGAWYNPQGTVPFPAPQLIGVPVWDSTPQFPVWTYNAAGPVFRTATWSSPTFDLRPDLRGAMQGQTTGGVNQLGGTAIWRPWGAGSQFHMLGVYNTFSRLYGLTVTAQEFAHVSDISRMVSITSPQDVTSTWSAAKEAALHIFAPPGNPYPVRFWRVQLVFTIEADNGANPDMTLQGSMY